MTNILFAMALFFVPDGEPSLQTCQGSRVCDTGGSPTVITCSLIMQDGESCTVEVGFGRITCTVSNGPVTYDMTNYCSGTPTWNYYDGEEYFEENCGGRSMGSYGHFCSADAG